MDAELTPAGGEYVYKVLSFVSMGLGIAAPPSHAMQIYADILGEYPVSLLDSAAREVIKGYVYPSFPRPAEFVNRMEDEHKDMKYWRNWTAEKAKAVELPKRRGMQQVEFDVKKMED